ncbi:MAG: hypothetical protein CBB71_00815 [Rhodopirellula sp. TMED11]|nr:MAG: hypothetical protein CBB71_00815 [Rhodopirellula sp. TMED11]
MGSPLRRSVSLVMLVAEPTVDPGWGRRFGQIRQTIASSSVDRCLRQMISGYRPARVNRSPDSSHGWVDYKRTFGRQV